MRGKRRDANEVLIIAALRAVGASVTQLDGRDIPDLLVGYRGVNYLVEIKAPAGSKGGTSHRELKPGQVRWHLGWKGLPVAVVRYSDEALRAIGARL